MKIIITIEDTEDEQIQVSEARNPAPGETEETVTLSTALADAMFEVMDGLAEGDWSMESAIRSSETGLE